MSGRYHGPRLIRTKVTASHEGKELLHGVILGGRLGPARSRRNATARVLRLQKLAHRRHLRRLRWLNPFRVR